MANQKIVELARRATKGDKSSFEELCREKQRDMMFVALSILGNHEDAEDAAQEAIIRMHKSICNLRDAGAINVWIERIVRNESFKIYNARALKQNDIDIDDEDTGIMIEEDSREFLPEAYAEDAALSEQLYRHVQSLAPAKRDTIIMYYYEGLSYKEIAEVTATSMKSVSSNLTKARMMLKKKLSQENNFSDVVSGLGIMPTATIMGRSLKLQSVQSLPDDKMAAFEQKWMAQVHDKPLPVRKGFKAAKTVIATVTTVAVFAVAVIAVGSLKDSAMPATPGQYAQTATTTVSQSGREIVFTGGDCDCGHINPQSAEVANLKPGDGEKTWEISSGADGAVIFKGDSIAVAAELMSLADSVKDGRFVLTCTFEDKDNKEITLKRAFTIGDYSGDAAV
jgi:RNA polymerase sigma-70 factor (ECF subfamily)